MKQFDAKYAPKNLKRQQEAENAKVSEHHRKVLELLTYKTRKRSPEYQTEARAFVEGWKRDYPEAYEKDTPEQIALATILAVSIREGMKEDADGKKETPTDPRRAAAIGTVEEDHYRRTGS